MTAIALKRPPLSNGLLWAGRVVLVAWGGFWIWFNVASGIGEIPELGVTTLLMHLIMPALILGVGYVAWRWPMEGGLSLFGLAALFAAVFGFKIAAILLAPPVVAGAFLVAATSLDWRQRAR